ncbi:MAG: amidohydrolase [Acidobacteria bacterium]|nr:amidohydrolase [Acidobacteriota bacterium]
MRLFAAILISLFIGCPTAAQGGAADLVILNSDVRTMDLKRPRATAIVVTGSRIVFVGDDSDARKYIGKGTRIIDAGGKLVVPGFNDSHVHFMAIGNKFSSLDAKGIAGSEEFYERLTYYLQFLPKGRWILGSGASKEMVAEINAAEIERIAPDNPLFIYAADPSEAIANSSARKLAGLAEAKNVVTVREIDLARIARKVPADHIRRWAEIAETASNYAASYGITSVQDTHSDDQSDVYRQLAAAGRLKTRVYDCSSLLDWFAKQTPPPQNTAGEMVRTGCLKGFHDGEDNWTPRLRQQILAADKARWQVAVHAIGSKPNSIVLDIFELAAKENGKRDRRFRIEHAEGILARDYARLGRLGVVVSIQPHLFGRGGYSSNYYRDLVKNGAIAALGSDAPMTAFDPLLGLNTRDAGNGFSFLDSIQGYTVGSAYAEFAEAEKGKLLSGMLADIVILSQNIFASSDLRISGAEVEVTIVNGKVVYEKNNTEK